MTNENTFLSALHEDPSDEVTWLALADWLEEDGQTERAELVRLMRQLQTIPVMKRTKRRAKLEDRLATLLNSGVRPVVPQIVNSIGMRFSLIPPGRFRMGSPMSEKRRLDNETLQEVEITQAFYLSVFPVTQAQYQAVMGHNPSYYQRGEGGANAVKDLSDAELADLPVETVSLEDAQTFLQKLSRLKAEKTRARQYRLPTEAEWEYACRGGACSTTAFHTGDSLDSAQANLSGNHTSRVGSYKPNVFGLFDMHGNVWEWCSDWHNVSAGQPEPQFPGPGSFALRGGSLTNSAGECRSACRGWGGPGDRHSHWGFRAALTVS